MELRCAWSLVGMGLWAILTSGCLLYPRDTTLPVIEARVKPEGSAEGDGSTGPPIVPPPPPPSNYHLIPSVARLSASVEPERDRGQLTVAAAVRGAAAREESPPAPPPPPPAPEPPLVGALRCALEKHPREARRLLEKYDKTDRELILALLQLTAGVSGAETVKPSPADMTALLEQITTLTGHLRQPAGLSLDHVCFCRKIDGFGQFESLPVSHEFQPGSEGRPGERVHVYAELHNFASQLTGGQYETTLASSLDIFDLQNRKVVSLNLGSCVDRCLTCRKDYFLNVQFHVPAKLPAGLYTLRLTVQDQTPGTSSNKPSRIATRSLDLRVGAVPAVANMP